ncbi:Glucoside xylosyltransferase 1 [Porphyridium purpureum]|uniref:UDP-D-xylose:beta-D-glucoside alpha-1,3-D-xylosyltransferase n=1 Tax=Porphyridium purpureum TaxID=35688 RepID=A0A5J4Z5Q3_PORPP|nr:Glucoside xylosyltransferase 1 [Porphyridium purpureum]|eukprot:POR5159..scf295_1
MSSIQQPFPTTGLPILLGQPRVPETMTMRRGARNQCDLGISLVRAVAVLFCVVWCLHTSAERTVGQTVERPDPSEREMIQPWNRGKHNDARSSSLLQPRQMGLREKREIRFLQHAVTRIEAASEATKTVSWRRQNNPYALRPANQVNLAMAVCSSKVWNLAEVALKSMFLFANTDRHYIMYMFANDGDVEKTTNEFEPFIGNLLDQLPNLSFELHVVPASSDKETNFFKPCSGQRLYIPHALPHVNKLLYLDADLYFLDDVSKLYDMFRSWTPDMLLGMSPEKSDKTQAYLKYCNAGIAMMNLEGLRKFDLLAFSKHLYTSGANLPFFDQDIFNHVCADSKPPMSRCFHMPCSWNYRTDHSWTPGCSHTVSRGGKVSLIHGNRAQFLKEDVSGPLPHRVRPYSRLAKKLWEVLLTCHPLLECPSGLMIAARDAVMNEADPCEFDDPYVLEQPGAEWKPTTTWNVSDPADTHLLWKLANGTCVNKRLFNQLKAQVDQYPRRLAAIREADDGMNLRVSSMIRRDQCGSWQYGPIGKRNIGQVPIGAIFSSHVLRAYRDTSVKYEAALFSDLEQNLHLGKDVIQDLSLAIWIHETNEQFVCDNGYTAGVTRNVVITCPIRRDSPTERHLEAHFRVTADLLVVGTNRRIKNIGLCLNEPIRAAVEPTAQVLERALREKKPEKLAMCVYVRNQRWRLMEWLSFYLAQGVNHIYIYKNENDDFTESFVSHLVKQGKVTIVHWAHTWCGVPYDRSQYTAVNDCFWTLRYKYDWVGLFDVDELFVSKKESEKLVDFVERPEFEQVSVLDLKTRKHCFDTSKSLPSTIKEEGYLRHLAFRSEKQDNRKNIVRPDRVDWGWLHSVRSSTGRSRKVSFDEAELLHVQAVELAEALGFETWLGHKVDPSCNVSLGSSPATRVVPDLQQRVRQNWQLANRSCFQHDQKHWDIYYFQQNRDFEGTQGCLHRSSRECCLSIET